jgi:hypothetical protein
MGAVSNSVKQITRIHSMEQSPPSEANSCSASQLIPSLL